MKTQASTFFSFSHIYYGSYQCTSLFSAFEKDCRIYQNGTTQHMNHTHVSPVHKKARPCQAAGIFPTRNPYNKTCGQKQGKNYVVSFITAFLKIKFAHIVALIGKEKMFASPAKMPVFVRSVRPKSVVFKTKTTATPRRASLVKQNRLFTRQMASPNLIKQKQR